MNKILKARNSMLFQSNVRILQKAVNGNLLTDLAVKNRVLRDYGVYSYIRFLLGSFDNGSIWDKQQYVPKYLAVGSNQQPLTGAPGTDTVVKFTDTSLFHELDDSAVTGELPENNRIKLNRGNYVEDNTEDGYIQIQYEAYIPEDRFVGETIGELALMTQKTGWYAYARVSGFEPFIKTEGSVVQIIWTITVKSIESSTRFIQLDKKYLRESIEKAINVLQVDTEDPEELDGARLSLDKLIEPATNVGTGLYYLLNDNEMITQDDINNYLSKPFNSLDNTGLISLIQHFPSGKDFNPIIQ